MTMRRVVTLPGQIESYAQTPIFAKITGYVEKFNADLGDEVEKDKVLIEISVPELVEEVERKKAAEFQALAEVEQAERAQATAEKSVVRAEATLKQTEAGLNRAEAGLKRWRAEDARMKQLLPTRAVDQSTADVAAEQLKTSETAVLESRAAIAAARAARDESQARRDQAVTDVKVAIAKQRVAESDRKRTEETLKYSKIRAPFTSVVTKRNVDVGHLLQPPTGAMSSTPPLFVLERIDKVRVFVDVPESNATGVAIGANVKIRVPALREQEFPGTVVRTSVALDTQGRTLRAQIDLPNPGARLRPGHYVSASIESEHPGSLTVPASAVFIANDQAMVVRVENGKAIRTPVRLGVRHGGKVEVIKKQLIVAQAGEAIEWQDFSGDEELIAVHPENWTDGQEVSRQKPGDGRTL